VHKSQGNEFEAVILPICRVTPQLAYRNLLYTAATRAKKLLIVLGNAGELRAMAQNDRKAKRYSALREFLLREGKEINFPFPEPKFPCNAKRNVLR